MHVGFVGQVHQVVDHQAVVALDVKQAAPVGPFIAYRPFQVGDQRRVGLILIAGPDPDESVALDHGIALVARETTYPLPWHLQRFPVAAHDQAVIAAHQVAVFDVSQRQRCAAMGAKVLDCHNLVFLAVIENDFFAADLPPERFLRNFIGCAGDVPGVFLGT